VPNVLTTDSRPYGFLDLVHDQHLRAVEPDLRDVAAAKHASRRNGDIDTGQGQCQAGDGRATLNRLAGGSELGQ